MARVAIKSAQIVEFLKAPRSQFKRKLLIVWDGAMQHKSRVVREYLDSTQGAIQMALLPAYAPRTSTRSNTCGLGSSGMRWPTSVPTPWPNSSTPLAANSRAARNANRSSSRAGK
ncbi:hypothetical protein CDC45_24345 (plasmid) [Ralstonia pseudosolanacearum]|nr:hypothetical protein CDC45_24180 [Ralstonia pseudosolanacearum]AST30291.1 hypothetical protein CDC45_24345 [Ralstonia pseudosolanacearum]QOK90020.1 hypothetical protein HF907_25330 [Ralstonia pseudosolanacearum]